VLEECYFVVIDRPGYRLGDAKKTLKGKYQGKMHKLSESEPVRDELLLSYKIFLLPIDALDVASTEVRERIRKGESIKDMVSKEVEAYIMDNRLYQTQKMPRKRVKKTVSKRSLPREVRVSAKAGKAKKGEELIVLDLRGICSFTDFFVIMHGNSTRQNVALYESVEQELKKESIAPLSVEGVENAEWILMDYGNFIVHVFSRNAREYYSLEKLWGDALKFSY
jgi:ribosome-associated protein